MAIWSLTKERVDKLLKQIGDKQTEIDELIKLSKETLWERDLDDFLDEWETQLTEEKENRKKVKNMKRRVSTKFGGGKSAKSRKGGDDDSDFGASKPKKAKKAETSSNLLNYLSKPKEAKPLASKQTEPMMLDGSSDIEAAVAAAKPKTVPTKPPAPSRPTKLDSSDIEGPSAARGARKAARKPVNYGALTDSDLESDGDFDIGKMVKTIGEPSASATARPLFSASISRPSSSAGLAARKSLTSGRPSGAAFDTESADETDYTRLAPAKASTAKATTILSDDEDELVDAMDIDAPKPAHAKPAPAALITAAALAAPAPKKRGRPAGAISKTKDKTAEKPTKAAATKAAGKKQSNLSMADKKAKPAPKASKKKTILSDDDDDVSDVEKMANEIISDDDEDEVVAVPPPKAKAPAAAKAKPKKAIEADAEDEDEDVAPRARPARRAATQTKKAWVVDDDDSDDPFAGMSDGFEDNDDDDD